MNSSKERSGNLIHLLPLTVSTGGELPMSIFMYIRQSLKKRFKMHFNMLIILVCAFILPFIFSFLRDSYIFGDKMQALNDVEKSHHAHYKIINAKEEHLPYFEKLTNLEAKYIEDAIYLYIKDSAIANEFIKGKLDASIEFQEYGYELGTMINEIGDSSLLLSNLSGIYRTGYGTENFSFQITFIIVIVILISMLVVQAAYRIHIGNFSYEIGILTAIGATKKQILKIFATELIILFSLSGALALAFTYTGMYLLFRFFLEVKESNFGWQIFHVNWLNTLIVFLIMFVFLAGVFVLLFYNFLKKRPISLLASSSNNEKLKHYKSTIKLGRSPITSFAKVLLRRSNKSFIQSIIISIPIVVVIIFVFNYASINVDMITTKSEYDIRLSKTSIRNGNDSDFNEDEIAFLKDKVDISKSTYFKNVPIGSYYVKSSFNLSSSPLVVIVNEEAFLKTGIRSVNEIPEELSFEGGEIEKGYVLLNKNHVLSKFFKVGDTLVFYKNNGVKPVNNENIDDHQHSDNELNNNFMEVDLGEPMYFTIGGFIDDTWANQFLVLYFNETDYNALTKEYGFQSVKIAVNDNVNYKDFIDEIRGKFNDNLKYNITDYRLEKEITQKGSIGIYILIEVILAVLFVFMVIILFVFLSEHIRGQGENIRLLYTLGASKDDVYSTYMLQAIIVGVCTLMFSFATGIGLSKWFFSNTGYYMPVNFMTTMTYSIITIVIMLSFLLPVHIGLRSKLKKL